MQQCIRQPPAFLNGNPAHTFLWRLVKTKHPRRWKAASEDVYGLAALVVTENVRHRSYIIRCLRCSAGVINPGFSAAATRAQCQSICLEMLFRIVDRAGLMFCYSSCFLSFFSPPNVGGRLADRHQTLSHVQR